MWQFSVSFMIKRRNVNLTVIFLNSKNWLSRTPGLETDGFDFTGKLKKGVSAWLKDLEDEANVI